MKTKDKIITRLNNAFGWEIPLDAPYMHHQKERQGRLNDEYDDVDDIVWWIEVPKGMYNIKTE